MKLPVLALLPSLTNVGVFTPPTFDCDREFDTILRPSLSNFGAEEVRLGRPGVENAFEVVALAALRGVRRESAAWGSWGEEGVLMRWLRELGLEVCGEKRERNENGRDVRGDDEERDAGGERVE